MAFCADILPPLDLVPLTDFIYKYRPGCTYCTKLRLRLSVILYGVGVTVSNKDDDDDDDVTQFCLMPK